MTEVSERAARADRVMRNRDYKKFREDVLAEQVAIFVNPNATAEEVLAAHERLRAIEAIQAEMTRAQRKQKMAEKRSSASE